MVESHRGRAMHRVRGRVMVSNVERQCNAQGKRQKQLLRGREAGQLSLLGSGETSQLLVRRVSLPLIITPTHHMQGLVDKHAACSAYWSLIKISHAGLRGYTR